MENQEFQYSSQSYDWELDALEEYQNNNSYSQNSYDSMVLNRDLYFRQKAIDIQNSIVNTKSATTITSDAFVWTYRTTNCDVVSIITTAIPIKEGNMKDINIESHEPKR